jgi:hypothetical protein
MPIQFSLGNGLLRAAVSLAFLGCLVAEGTLYGQAAASEPLIVTSEAGTGAFGATPSFSGSQLAAFAGSTCQADTLRFNCSASTLANPVEIGVPDEFGVAVEDEDSIEMFRFDIQQRTFVVDRTVIRAKAAPKIARSTRLSISPPLLV